MKFKNSNGYGVLAALAAGLFVFLLLPRRLRWGFWFMSFLIASMEKWSEKRELRRIYSILDKAN